MSMPKKINAFEAAMSRDSAETPKTETAPENVALVQPTRKPRRNRPDRSNKTFVGVYLSNHFLESLDLLKEKTKINRTRRTNESLLSEALNDLFAKYNVPVVRVDKQTRKP